MIALLLAACSAPPTAPTPEPAAPAPAPAPTSSITATEDTLTLSSDAGPIEIRAVYHGTLVLKAADQVLWLDPWSKGDLTVAGPATVLLLTDIHPDHLDADAIAAVTTDETVIVAPSAVAEALAPREVAHVLENGETVTVGAITVTATPMYNLTRGPEPGVLFHDKGRGNGYLVDYGGRRIYLSGDTACTDEMKALANVDVAFVTMNLPYTMPPDEAAACVSAFRPTVAVPFHYGDSDLSVFRDGVAEAGVEVHQLEFYAGGLPF